MERGFMVPLRRFIPGLTLRAEIALISILVALLLLNTGFAILYVHQSQRQWCELLHTLTLPPEKGSPPLTPRGRQVVGELKGLERGLGC